MLDSKISKAEKEIRALENTLAVMNAKNEGYRKSLGTADPSSECTTVLCKCCSCLCNLQCTDDFI